MPDAGPANQSSMFPTPVVVDESVFGDAGALRAVQIDVGVFHVCALMNDGTVRCWGNDASTAGSTAKRSVQGLTGVSAVDVWRHSCVRTDDGNVRCWGQNDYGQTADSSELTPILGLSDVKQISAGGWHTCALLDDGSVRCWGRNDRGQTADSDTQTAVEGLPEVLQVSAGNYDTCALTQQTVPSEGQPIQVRAVRCWGDGQPGITTPIEGLALATQINVGFELACALMSDTGGVRCWGRDEHGQLGGGSSTMDIPGLSGVVQVAAGTHHGCALIDDGTVRCWGNPELTAGSNPTKPIEGLVDVAQISAGHHATCALLTNGSIGCWGREDLTPLK